MVAIDRRDSFRLKVNKDQVHIKEPARLKKIRFDNISASGASLLIPVGGIDGLGKSPLILNLEKHASFETRVIPIHTIVKDEVIRIGVRFQDMNQDTLGSLSRFLIDRFFEQNKRNPNSEVDKSISIFKNQKKVIENLLVYYCKFRSFPLRIYNDEALLPLRLNFRSLIKFENQEFIHLVVDSGDEDMLEASKEYTFAFPGVNAVNYFSSVVWNIEPGSLWITFPSQIRQSGFRNSLRVALDPGQKIEFIIDHPRLGGVSLKKTILEVGARGFSFPLDPGHDMFSPGELITSSTLVLADGLINVEGVIRSMHDHSGIMSCGFEILRFSNQEEQLRWRTFVLLATYRNLKLGRREDAAAYWKILESSGYIREEVTHALRSSIKEQFFREWERHSENPKINQNLIYFKDKKAVGTFSMNLLYPKTGLGHHMSVDKRVRKSYFEIGRELFSGLQYVFQHLATTEYYVSYFYAEKTFNDLMFRRFFNQYPEKDNYVYDRFHLYKYLINLKQNEIVAAENNIDVKQADPKLLKILSQFLKENLSEIEFEAFSYDVNEITLDAFSKECFSHDYERKRRIFFAVEGEKPVAALIAETGDLGVNSFNLLNCCWIIYLISEAKQNDRILERLLLQAIQFYTKEGKPEFIFLEYNDIPKERIEKYCFTYFTDGMRWLGNKDMLPSYLNYIEETLSMINNRYRPE